MKLRICIVNIFMIFFTSLAFSNQKVVDDTIESIATVIKDEVSFILKKEAKNYSVFYDKHIKDESYTIFTNTRSAGLGMVIPGGILLYCSIFAGGTIAISMGWPYNFYVGFQIASMYPFIIVWAVIGGIMVGIGGILFIVSGYYLYKWMREKKIASYSRIDDKNPAVISGWRILL